MTRFTIEDALLAVSQWLNVAEPVEDGKSVAVQENPGAVVGKRRLRTNVELIIDFDDISAGRTCRSSLNWKRFRRRTKCRDSSIARHRG